jgi:hypothetical protein
MKKSPGLTTAVDAFNTEERLMREYTLALNDREKQLVEELFQKLASGEFAGERLTNKTNALRHEISYAYHANQQEKILHGAILNCRYRLRRRDRNRVFFSAGDCNDVCSVFYDMLALIYVMNQGDVFFANNHDPFDVDLHTERYIFCTGQLAVSFAKMADYLHFDVKGRVSLSSQYVFSLFEESNRGGYGALIDSLKTGGYSSIRILQIWIRGEILYYVTADGAALRPEHQRALTPKEEADIDRKICKAVTNRLHHIDLKQSGLFSENTVTPASPGTQRRRQP